MRIAVDTGGTFTDCVFVRDGKLTIVKVASRPGMPEEAIAEVILKALPQEKHDPSGKPVRRPKSSGKDLHLDLVCGTTVGTNALLERRGGRVTLVTTAGFEDVLEIGRQARPKLYDFFAQKPAPLIPAERRIGVRERLAWDGSVVNQLTPREIKRIARAVRRNGSDAIAVCFLFSFRNPRHEKRIASALRGAGHLVSVSHEILPEFREYERTSTTVVNAYLAPVMTQYLTKTQSRVRHVWNGENASSTARSAAVRIMQSNGGIVSAHQAAKHPVTTILSGPAGGLIGAAYAAELAGLHQVITCDMGGTSTDVALLTGQMQTTSESVVAGVPVAVPMLEIHTVGAGGGSIARFDRGGALRVGPESAGADPGPICYGRGDRPTVTDAHAVLGHFAADGLLGGAFALDIARARKYMLDYLRQHHHQMRASFRTVEQFAEGILAVVNAVMEKAIRVISVQRGHDPRDYALLAFGGAGGLHACSLAAGLDIRRVLLPVFPGALSALGILRADVVLDFSRTVLLPSIQLIAPNSLVRLFRPLENDANRSLRNEGFTASMIRIERQLDIRYVGQAYEISIPAHGNFTAAFHRAHQMRYGYHDASRPVEIVNVRCRATGITAKPNIEKLLRMKHAHKVPPAGTLRCVLDGKMQTVRLIAREQLRAGHSFSGPALISEYSATTIIPEGWAAKVDDYGQILVTRI
jgi:N-methylhydantoinase A